MDAGTNSVDHYKERMGPWRFWFRDLLLVVVRHETPILARLQQIVRTPVLDTYFAMSANIGTHTFYMMMLPVFFWCGLEELGLDVVWVLAIGVFSTGYIKDLLCLPRPRSPPLHRISMSGSAKLEYGMPSTHSCNAVSVVLVLNQLMPHNQTVKWISIWLISTLISGRLYTGMHGFLDVIVGCICGVLCHQFRCIVKANLIPTSLTHNLVVTLGFALVITLCTEPVDNCPCFDDSVAFSGVVIGIGWAMLFRENFQSSSDDLTVSPLKAKYSFLFSTLRSLVGVSLVLVWRYVSKRVLLKILPPIWRVLDQLGLKNPRRYFLEVGQYTKIKPENFVDGSVPESSEKIKEMLKSLKQTPQDIVGPQSESDLYELQSESPKSKAKGAQNKIKDTTNHSQIEEPRKHYDIEVVMRLIIYGGIGFTVLVVAPTCFRLLYL